MSYSNDTEPRMQRVSGYRSELQAPPRILFYGVIGLFLLVIIGIIAAIFIFTQVLQPSQQQRVINMAPFMRSFLPPTPPGGVLPTVMPDAESNQAAQDLLNMPLVDASATPDGAEVVPTEATSQPSGEPTEAAQPTLEPTEAAVVPSPTFTLTWTPTAVPTSEPTATVEAPPAVGGGTNESTSVVQNMSLSNLPASTRLAGFRWIQQSWNNCGPATMTMALSYYGWQNDQDYAKDRIRPNREDKNTNPHELADFVNEYTDLKAVVRMGGSINTLRALLANEYPVIIERGIMFEANDWLGHYQALVAYEDSSRGFYAYDSWLGAGEGGAGVYETYSEVDEDWRAFNRTFIVIYPPQEEARVMEILGPLADETQAAEIAFQTARDEASANPQDGFAWFNMGTSLVALGRYEEAANAYAQAGRYSLPWRMPWYQFAPFVALYETGRYEELMTRASTILNTAPELEEVYYWRGRAYEAQGQVAQATSQYQQALRYNSTFDDARAALDQL